MPCGVPCASGDGAVFSGGSRRKRRCSHAAKRAAHEGRAQEVSMEPHCIQLLPVERTLCSRQCFRLGAVSWARWQGRCSCGVLFQSRGGL